MKKFLLIILIVFLSALFQTSFTLEFFGNAWNPNLILALAFSFIAVGKTENGLLSAFIGGLLLDFIGPTLPGVSSLVLTVLLSIGIWLRKYFHSTILSLSLVTCASSFIYSAVLLFPEFTQVSKCLGVAMTTTVFFLIFTLINKWLSNESKL